MKAVEFKEHNKVLAKDQPQYRSLPVYQAPHDHQGTMVSCYQLSWRERFKIFLTDKNKLGGTIEHSARFGTGAQ